MRVDESLWTVVLCSLIKLRQDFGAAAGNDAPTAPG